MDQMEEVKEVVKASLKNLNLEDKFDDLMKCLEKAGVEHKGELKLVNESDLIQVLKPIKSRSLIQSWNKEKVQSCK